MNQPSQRLTPPHIAADHQLADHSEGDPKPGKSHWFVWLLMILLVAGLFYWLWHRKPDAPAAGSARGGAGGPVTTVTAKATQGDIGVYDDAIGTVTPIYTDSIVSQVTGVVQAVHYKEGQLVHKGDPLVDIDPREYAATLKQAQGALQRDQALLAEAQMDLDRYKQANDRNAIARQQYEDQVKLVQQDEGTVKNDQGTVDYDTVQLSYCHIVSPITGRVGLRLVDPGNLVSAGGSTVLAVVTQMQPISVVFTISEDKLQTVLDQMRPKKGSKAEPLQVQAWDRNQTRLLTKGTLATTDNLIDTTTGTIKLRAIFDNQDTTLFPNQFVNTRLLVNTLKNVTLLPSTAIQHNDTQAFVWLIQDGKANIRNITEGVSDGNMTQVDGVDPGDEVANGSFEKLHPGATIVRPGQGGGKPGQGKPGAAGQGMGGKTSGPAGSTAP